MLLEYLAIVPKEMVAEQHFFLEELMNPPVLWGIRGVCIAAGVIALIIYFKMKHKKGE